MVCSILALVFSRQAANIKVRWVDDEPKAVLAILHKEEAHEQVADADWQKLFETEGYKRLKDREAGMRRPFTDDSFKTFVSSPDLVAKASGLEKALASWGRIEVVAMGSKCLKYLPKEAVIKASVFPLIKPITNSFVWGSQKDPAIMLYLDPAESAQAFAVTVTHEFHHIGYASCCPSKKFESWAKTQSGARQKAWMWVGAFGEGYAVLAAAGNREVDPMATFNQQVKDAWNYGMEHLAEDMDKLSAFFMDTISGKIPAEMVQSHASKFYDVQGPWYTVGYVQATTIERIFGHAKLMDCYRDPRLLMPTYNAAVARLPKDAKRPPIWSADLIKAFS